MYERREFQISIGKRTYRMQTDLSESESLRVRDVVSDISRSMGDDFEQDQILLLTCLQLAYNLEKISQTLEPLNDRLGNLTPWRPSGKSE